jgi:hypothetical protein
MYERRSQPPLTRGAFAARLLHHFLLAIGFVVVIFGWGYRRLSALRAGCVNARCISQRRHAAWRHGPDRAPPDNDEVRKLRDESVNLQQRRTDLELTVLFWAANRRTHRKLCF